MKFHVILVVVYWFGEFGFIKFVENTKTEHEIVIRKMNKDAAMEFLDHFTYRYTTEESAHMEVIRENLAYKSYLRREFNENQRPRGRTPRKLWKRAKEALNNFNKSKNFRAFTIRFSRRRKYFVKYICDNLRIAYAQNRFFNFPLNFLRKSTSTTLLLIVSLAMFKTDY